MENRTFFGIQTEQSDAIESLIEKAKKIFKWEKIKWVDSSDLHTTIYFFGLLKKEIFLNIQKHLRDKMNDITPFTLEYKGVGVFKNIETPRSLWIGVEENKTLSHIKNLTNSIVKDEGLHVDDFSFTPHITIGRLKWLDQQSSINRFMKEFENTILGTQVVEKLVIFESVKQMGNKKYKIIDEITL